MLKCHSMIRLLFLPTKNFVPNACVYFFIKKYRKYQYKAHLYQTRIIAIENAHNVLRNFF